MEQLVNFLVWMFTAIGITVIVTRGNIFAYPRHMIGMKSKWLGMLLNCPMCFIFWASLVVSLLTESITGNLFLDGCLGSGLWFYVTFGIQQPQGQPQGHHHGHHHGHHPAHSGLPMPQTQAPKNPTPHSSTPKKQSKPKSGPKKK